MDGPPAVQVVSWQPAMAISSGTHAPAAYTGSGHWMYVTRFLCRPRAASVAVRMRRRSDSISS